VLALAHSVVGRERAEQLLSGTYDAAVLLTGSGALGARRAIRALLGRAAPVVYLVDVGISTTVAALIARALGRRVLLDTGDVAYELARSVGGRSAASLLAVRLGEQAALRASHHVIVRGRRHASLIPRPATHIPDLAPPGTAPRDGGPVRRRLGLERAFVVGLVGSIRLAPALGITYGWDLVEALTHSPVRVHALIVGDGDGLPQLQARARELGVHGRCRFVGRVASQQVDTYIGAMDVAISTQSDDTVGAVRTTGKLPLYLAGGCPVLATHVGEAIDLLAPLGWTLPYEGVVDRAYPARLGAAITAWEADPGGAGRRREQALELSGRAFDAAEMRERLRSVITSLLATSSHSATASAPRGHARRGTRRRPRARARSG
jgi:glycosyltransferase involved in cell wall biosynthesis